MKWKIGIGIVSFVVAGLIFVLLLQIREKQSEPVEYQTVVVTKSQVMEDTYVNVENINTIFEVKDIPVEYVPGEAVCEMEDVLDRVIQADLDSMCILTKGMMKSEDVLYKEYESLQWISLAIQNSSQALAGRLRSGDLIDIYAVEEVVDRGIEAMKVAEAVRVHRTYTKEGGFVDVSDTDALVQMIEIPVQEEQVSELLTSIDAESIRIVKYE